MVALYVGGSRIGTLSDSANVLRGLIGRPEPVEVRDESGTLLGRFQPEPICPWEPTLTREELDARCARPGKPLEAILRRLEAQ